MSDSPSTNIAARTRQRLSPQSSVLITLLLVACHREPARLRIGLVSGLTGPTAAWGEAIRRGAQMAVDDANAHRREKIELVVEDDQGRPEQSAVVVERLLTEKNVAGIVGCDTSGRTLAASPISEHAGVVMISPTASAPAVTRDKRFTFRVCATDDGEAIAAARLARERLHAKKVAILRDTKNDYSVGMTQTFALHFGPSEVFDYAEGDSDFRAQLTSAGASHPDAIFVPGYYSDVAQVAIQARDLGIAVPLFGGSGWDSPKLLEIAGRSIEGCWFVSGVRSASPRFVEAFRARYHADPDAANAEAYDAAAILCAALDRAGGSRAKLREHVAATRDFPGASGAITLGADGNARKPLAVFEVKGGRFVESGTIPPP